MDTYEQAKKSAIEKVLLRIAESGEPTKEQVSFLERYKPQPSLEKDLATMTKMLDLFIGGKK